MIKSAYDFRPWPLDLAMELLFYEWVPVLCVSCMAQCSFDGKVASARLWDEQSSDKTNLSGGFIEAKSCWLKYLPRFMLRQDSKIPSSEEFWTHLRVRI